MIVRNESTRVVLGRQGATAAAVTAATGLAPTRSAEAGAVEEIPRDHSVWHLGVRSETDDESGFESMRTLLGLILPAAAALRALQERYEVRIDWAGFSDSSQGGFVLDAAIAGDLGAVGLPVYGTAYLD